MGLHLMSVIWRITVLRKAEARGRNAKDAKRRSTHCLVPHQPQIVKAHRRVVIYPCSLPSLLPMFTTISSAGLTSRTCQLPQLIVLHSTDRHDSLRLYTIPFK